MARRLADRPGSVTAQVLIPRRTTAVAGLFLMAVLVATDVLTLLVRDVGGEVLPCPPLAVARRNEAVIAVRTTGRTGPRSAVMLGTDSLATHPRDPRVADHDAGRTVLEADRNALGGGRSAVQVLAGLLFLPDGS